MEGGKREREKGEGRRRVFERAKRAHSLVMTFEIFHIYMLRHCTSSVRYLEYGVMRMCSQLRK